MSNLPNENISDKVTELANRDTPSGVHVLNSWPSLAAWALGRFGIGIVFAFMAWQFYQDQRLDYNRVLAAFESQTKVNAEQLAAINGLRQSIDEMLRRNHANPTWNNPK